MWGRKGVGSILRSHSGENFSFVLVGKCGRFWVEVVEVVVSFLDGVSCFF